MADIIKETIKTQVVSPEVVEVTPVEVKATSLQTAEYTIYYISGAIEILLAFRLVLKMMSASTLSGFVRGVYGLSGIFVMPFEGIFRKTVAQGMETAAILEPSTIVAIGVYAVIAWGVVSLVKISSGKVQE